MESTEKELGFMTTEEVKGSIRKLDPRLMHPLDVTGEVKKMELWDILNDLRDGCITARFAEECIKDRVIDRISSVPAVEEQYRMIKKIEGLLEKAAINKVFKDMCCPYDFNGGECERELITCDYCWVEYIVKMLKGEADGKFI